MTDFEFLSQPGRKVAFRYECLDRTDQYRFPVSVSDCSITYDSLSELKSSARFSMPDNPSVDFLNDRIRVVCTVTVGAEAREYPLGVYLLSSPARNTNGLSVVRDIEGYSKLQIYADDLVESRYIVAVGTNIVNEIIRLLGTFKYRIPSSALTLATNREWEIGTSKLKIINDLLETINYTSLRVGNDGHFESEVYVLPADRPVDFAYLNIPGGVLGTDVTDDLDLFSVPNVFVRYIDNPDVPALRSVYINDNPYSPSSTVNRGRNITSCEKVDDVADQATLDAIARRDAANASQVYSHVSFSTAIMPIHGYMNTIRLRHKTVDGIYQETGWEIDCRAGEMMRHTVRKVVQV